MKRAILLICVLALGWMIWPSIAPAIASFNFSASGNTDIYSVAGKPTISASKIDGILCSVSSPACSTGKSLYSLGVQYGIDPVFALAFFQHESSFGTQGVARVNLGLGNIRCTSGYVCKSGYRAYSSWVAGYVDWYKLIAEQYMGKWKLTTVEQIILVYAPAGENDTQGYINAVEQSVDAWRK